MKFVSMSMFLVAALGFSCSDFRSNSSVSSDNRELLRMSAMDDGGEGFKIYLTSNRSLKWVDYNKDSDTGLLKQTEMTLSHVQWKKDVKNLLDISDIGSLRDELRQLHELKEKEPGEVEQLSINQLQAKIQVKKVRIMIYELLRDLLGGSGEPIILKEELGNGTYTQFSILSYIAKYPFSLKHLSNAEQEISDIYYKELGWYKFISTDAQISEGTSIGMMRGLFSWSKNNFYEYLSDSGVWHATPKAYQTWSKVAQTKKLVSEK